MVDNDILSLEQPPEEADWAEFDAWAEQKKEEADRAERERRRRKPGLGRISV